MSAPNVRARSRGALSHIRVLDMSRVLAGPWCGQILAGAEVIKIERPGSGDDTRGWGPPYLKDQEGRDTQESAYFLGANRGKKSVTLDISKAQGQELARKLAAQCDVLIENYRAGSLARYGLGYEQLRALNPLSATTRSSRSFARPPAVLSAAMSDSERTPSACATAKC